MKKCIDAESTYIAVAQLKKLTKGQVNTTLSLALKAIQDQQALDVRSNVRVRKEIHGDGKQAWFCCGSCHKKVDMEDKFCRHCGCDFKPEGVM